MKHGSNIRSSWYTFADMFTIYSLPLHSRSSSVTEPLQYRYQPYIAVYSRCRSFAYVKYSIWDSQSRSVQPNNSKYYIICCMEHCCRTSEMCDDRLFSGSATLFCHFAKAFLVFTLPRSGLPTKRLIYVSFAMWESVCDQVPFQRRSNGKEATNSKLSSCKM